MSKYNAKKVEYKGIVFDSTVECEYYQYLEKQKELGLIEYIELQPRFELLPKMYKQRKTEYVGDFGLWYDGELKLVIDVKGMPTPLARYKAKHFRYKYPNIKLMWVCKAPKYTGKQWITYEELIKARRERKKAK
ncbi:hypothetical protein AZH47_10095 [Corynebacterium striatum]|uniref:DUF1064 domain-containing protein n=1 Tax=Staphylococcus ureilyticus TaxID=94138 RepID=UPI000C46BC2D|nr:DUF1064 domain-containing protein [Staphylococcus ureilyticus]PIS62219.1 hypothetical protein AZH47_10095 [Corynebacterium striatum]